MTTKKERTIWFRIGKWGLGILVCLFLVFLYSHFVGTHGVQIKEYKIVNKKVTETFHGIKLVHFSDLHYGVTTSKKDLDAILAKINLLNPDIVVFTGDLFDHKVEVTKEMQEELTSFLKNIDVSMSKYAIKGEEDNLDLYPTILEESGFQLLDHSYDTIYNEKNEFILIAEVEDETMISSLSALEPNYAILLLHDPEQIKEIPKDSFDLVLAGHHHGGGMRLPLIGGLFYPKGSTYHDSYYRFGSMDFYISTGIGTSKFPYRLFNRPSINFYRITNH